MDASRYDAIVIGAGPAGLTAGLYLARSGRRTLCLEQGLVGGQIATTSHLENYPGFPEGISGRALMEAFEAQARKFGLDLQAARVEGLELSGEDKVVRASGFPFIARVVVVATGIVQKLGIPGEEEYLGRGLSYCATCDGALYRGRAVAVTGVSDWAVEEALFLSRFVSKLYMVVRPAQLKESDEHRRELLAHPAVEVVGGAEPTEVLGDSGGVTGLRVTQAGQARDLAVDGVFVFSGKKRPGTEFLQGVVELDAEGYVRTSEVCESSVPGIYAVGDVRRPQFHQVATAVGDGAVAGMDAARHFRTGSA